MAIDLVTLGGIISSVSESIASITKTISDNVTERERIQMEGWKLDAEIAERMKEREVATKRCLQEQQAKLDALCIEREMQLAQLKVDAAKNKVMFKKDIKELELTHKQHMTELANQRRRDDMTHKERMEILSIIKLCMQEANRQVTIYREDRIQYGEGYFPLEGIVGYIARATESLNAAAQTLMLPAKGD